MTEINKQMKAKLREEFKAQRKSLTAKVKQQLDEQIIQRLLKTAVFQRAKKVAAYYPFGSEINLKLLFELPLNKTFFLPAVEEKKLQFRLFQPEQTKLVNGPYGIKQPTPASPAAAPEEIDLIIVPGLAFDENLNRLGYGGGYYDRYLPKTTAFKLALAYSFLVVKRLPTSEHDIKLDAVITEKEFFGLGITSLNE